MELVLAAEYFARAVHHKQVRKYTGEPYANHLEEVAKIVAAWNGDQEMVAAAWLHDSIEDQDVNPELLSELFGSGVRELVEWLTDVSIKCPGLNRRTRKALDREHLADAPGCAQNIKLADLISNTSSIVFHDPKFARVYLQEKSDLLDVLTKADPAFLECARDCLQMGVNQLTLGDKP